VAGVLALLVVALVIWDEGSEAPWIGYADPALFPLDDAWGIGIGRFHNPAGIELTAFQAHGVPGVLVEAERRWRRRVLEVRATSADREDAPFLQHEGYLAAITHDDDVSRFEVFAKETGYTVASTPLPRLAATPSPPEGGSSRAWRPLLRAFGDLGIVAFPADSHGILEWHIMGFSHEAGADPARFDLRQKLHIGPLRFESGLRDVLVTRCEVLLVPWEVGADTLRVIPRPDVACSTDWGRVSADSQSAVVLDRGQEHAIVVIDVPHGTSILNEVWLFEPDRSVRLLPGADSPPDLVSPLNWRSYDGRIGLDGAHLGPNGVWLEGVAWAMDWEAVSLFVPKALIHHADGMRITLRVVLPATRLVRVDAMTLDGRAPSFSRWGGPELISFGFGDVWVQAGLSRGLRFAFIEGSAPTAVSFFPDMRETSDYRTGPASPHNRRLVSTNRGMRLIEVGPSPSDMIEITVPEAIQKHAAGQDDTDTVLGYGAIWVVHGKEREVSLWMVPAYPSTDTR